VRRLVVEVKLGQRFLAGPLSGTVKSVEVLNILRHEKKEISLICRARFRNPRSSGNRLFDDDVAEVHELERDSKGVPVLFVRRRLPRLPKSLDPMAVYVSVPWRIENGIGRATYLGSAKQIRRALRAIERAGIPYKIISLTDARFSPSSLLGLLTDRQREVVSEAFRHGYYDIPRKTRSDELAASLGMSNASFVNHRRKAERRIVAEALSEH